MLMQPAKTINKLDNDLKNHVLFQILSNLNKNIEEYNNFVHQSSFIVISKKVLKMFMTTTYV